MQKGASIPVSPTDKLFLWTVYPDRIIENVVRASRLSSSTSIMQAEGR
jgi:hypothetical protein